MRYGKGIENGVGAHDMSIESTYGNIFWIFLAANSMKHFHIHTLSQYEWLRSIGAFINNISNHLSMAEGSRFVLTTCAMRMAIVLCLGDEY